MAENIAELLRAGRALEALERLRPLLAANPATLDLRLLVAQACSLTGAWDEANGHYDAVLAALPVEHPAWGSVMANRSAARLSIGRSEDAREDARAVLARDSASFGGWINLGLAEERLGDIAAACAAFEQALRVRPDDPRAEHALARTLSRRGDAHRRSRSLLERVLARDPDDAEIRLLLANALSSDAEVEAADAQYAELLRRHPDFHQAHSTWLIAQQYDPKLSARQLSDAHRNWAERHATPRAPLRMAAPPRERLRIGWLSPRFGEGPLAAFFLPVLSAFDRTRTEHVLYATHPAQGEVGQRFRDLADHWIDLSASDPETVANQLAADDLDVLVDLTGHAPGNCLRALAWHPAALVVSWLDYFCTTGLQSVDLFLSDAVLSPPGTESLFSERLLRLPQGRVCYRPWIEAPEPVSPQHAEGPVFGCFNRASKLGDGVLAAWGRIAAAVPKARFQLRAGAFADPEACRYFLQRCETQGLDPARVRLDGFCAYPELLRAYGEVDIALDPFPFAGCATTCDALWMGVPVITLAGETLVSRQSAAILEPLGLGDLVAGDVDGYVERALGVVSDAPRRRELRGTLRQRLSELHDPVRFARDFEALLRDELARAAAER